MLVSLFRIIKYGLANFFRNSWLTFSTLIIMILALLTFEGLIVFNIISRAAVQSIQDKIDITVYFKNNVSEDQILSIKKTLEGLAEVKAVEYISQEVALENFRKRHQQNETITQALEELDTNPLLPSLNLKAHDSRNYGMIAEYLENSDLKPLLEKVTYAQNEVVIKRLNKFIDAIKKTGIVITLFLAISSILVAFNTIRLAIYSNSDQIGIMRLVGASNSFIKGPYIFEGILYGLISGILSFLIWLPIIKAISPYLNNFVLDFNLVDYFGSNFEVIFFYQLVFGIILGIVSALIAIRKYVKI